jgi:hypothetical protein
MEMPARLDDFLLVFFRQVPDFHDHGRLSSQIPLPGALN